MLHDYTLRGTYDTQEASDKNYTQILHITYNAPKARDASLTARTRIPEIVR